MVLSCKNRITGSLPVKVQLDVSERLGLDPVCVKGNDNLPKTVILTYLLNKGRNITVKICGPTSKLVA
jgi:hypothetical protein